MSSSGSPSYSFRISSFSLPGLTADRASSPLLFGVVTIKRRENLLAVNPSLARKGCTCYLNPGNEIKVAKIKKYASLKKVIRKRSAFPTDDAIYNIVFSLD